MARKFRIFGKKRGTRRTGSRVIGRVSETIFFAALLLLGSFALIALITAQFVNIPGETSVTPGNGMVLAILVATTFLLIGLGGLAYNLMQVGTSVERRTALVQKTQDIDLRSHQLPAVKAYPTVPRRENLLNSPGTVLSYRLPRTVSPAWSMLAKTLVALLWNGSLAAVIAISVEGVRGHDPRWIATLLILPLGYVVVRTTRTYLLQLVEAIGIGVTNVEVSDLPLYPGQRYEVCVSQIGRGRITSLELQLVCYEEATFRQGTDVRTEQCVAYRERLFQAKDLVLSAQASFQQQADLLLPENAMHSFQSASNSIQWKLEVSARLARGTSFQRSYPVVVYPSPVASE